MSKGIATNMASEFYVASILWRLGFDVTITLGHTKEIDIIAWKKGKEITIDVKGRIGGSHHLLQLDEERFKRKNHFFIFVRWSKRNFSKV